MTLTLNSIPTGAATPAKTASKRSKSAPRTAAPAPEVLAPAVNVATRLIQNCGWPTDAEPRTVKRPKRN